jgi:hypothetical protein
LIHGVLAVNGIDILRLILKSNNRWKYFIPKLEGPLLFALMFDPVAQIYRR